MKWRWRILAAVLVFAAVTAGMLYLGFTRQPQKKEEQMAGQPELPVLCYRQGEYFTEPLYGHCSRNAAIKGAENVLVLGQDRKLSFSWDKTLPEGTKTVLSLRKKSDESLLDERDVTGEKETVLGTLLEEGEETLLLMSLTKKDGGKYHYGIRLIYLPQLSFDGYLSLAGRFSEAALLKNSTFLNGYLTTDKTRAGSNLTYVNLFTPVSLVTYGGMELTPQGERTLTVTAASDTQLTFRLSRKVVDEQKITYEVQEAFCIRFRNDRYYLLSYERSMEEDFTGAPSQVGLTSLMPGLVDRSKSQVIQNASQERVAFSLGSSLWYYQYPDHTLMSVMTDIRGEGRQIPLSFTEEGVLWFARLGYVDRGSYEGEDGLLVCSCDPKDKAIKERIFIRTEEAFPDMTDSFAKVLYLNEKGLLYVVCENQLFAVDVNSGEIQTVAVASDGRLLSDRDGQLLAFVRSATEKTITILNMVTGESRNIEASEGKEIIGGGFLGRDFLYGEAERGKTVSLNGVTEKPLMDVLYVVDETGSCVARYEKEGIFVTDIRMGDGYATLKRVKATSYGYETVEEDLISPQKDAEKNAGGLSLATSKTRLNYAYLPLKGSVGSKKELVRQTAFWESADSVTVSMAGGTNEGFTVFDGLGFTGHFTEFSAAAHAAFDRFGRILYQGEEIWNREARALTVSLYWDEMEKDLSEKDELAAILSRLYPKGAVRLKEGESFYSFLLRLYQERMLNLDGCKVSEILYFLNAGRPVVWILPDQSLQMFCGYTSSEVTLYTPGGRVLRTLTHEEADDELALLGGVLISYR